MFSSLLPLITSTFTSTNTQLAFKARTNQTQGFRVSCNAAQDDKADKKLILPESQKLVVPSVDRRNLLVGLGGLYTAANLPSAIAAPITAPDITSICKEASLGIKNQEGAVRTRKCCPPNLGKKIKEFRFPTENTVRMRWPAHDGDKKQVDDYTRAIQAMRDLPDDHPHSFASQAKIHCAYCNGGYTQIDSGFPEIDIQIHNSWLFFPFHRWYIYFYERILGKLINEPNFALPYWQWDDPEGMLIPQMFVAERLIDGKRNPLYDVYRDPNHMETRLIDLDYGGKDKDIPYYQQVSCNLSTVYRDLVRNGGDPISFFGGKYVAGDSPVGIGDPSVGSVEAGTHTAVHLWVGDLKGQPNGEDMGNFYSAGYDPAFYIHHVNIDRIWKIWKDLRLRGHVEPTDPDWLNASYVFYDENMDLVRVYNKDCVDFRRLKYDFIENPRKLLPWRRNRPPPRRRTAQVNLNPDAKLVEKVQFPVRLNQILKFKVKRPAVNRSDEDKAKFNEVLLIKGVRYDTGKFVKFDVFVNDKLEEGEITTPCDPEYAGGFAQIPHNDIKMLMKSSARFGLTELLEDTNTEDEEYAIVTLVPQVGCEDLTVGEIKIELVPVSEA